MCFELLPTETFVDDFLKCVPSMIIYVEAIRNEGSSDPPKHISSLPMLQQKITHHFSNNIPNGLCFELLPK